MMAAEGAKGAPSSPGRGSASGQRQQSFQVDESAISNVVTMVCFATALMENLARINRGEYEPIFESRRSWQLVAVAGSRARERERPLGAAFWPLWAGPKWTPKAAIKHNNNKP